MTELMHFVITCDGGSLGNGSGISTFHGSFGYGSYMISAPGNVGKITKMNFGSGITNNQAEYLALIGAMKHIKNAFEEVAADLKAIELTVRTDSQLVIGQVCEGWKVKAEHLRPLVMEVKVLCQSFHSVNFEKITGDEMKKILGH